MVAGLPNLTLRTGCHAPCLESKFTQRLRRTLLPRFSSWLTPACVSIALAREKPRGPPTLLRGGDLGLCP